MYLSPPNSYYQLVKPNSVFSNFSDPAITLLHQPNELVISELLPKYQNTFSLIWVWWENYLANELLKGMSMERVRVEEFVESKG